MAKRVRPPKRKRENTTRNSKTTKRSPRTTGGKRKKTERRPGSPQTVYLGLGSNWGNRRAHLEAALSEIARIAPLCRVSSFYRSEPVGYTDQPEFWNAAARLLWRDSPEELLRTVQRVEGRVGRTPTFRNGPREIDVDILDFGGLTRRTADPLLPHPRLESRRFVLAPLAEIAPEWRHPVSGRTARQLLSELPRTPRVRRILHSRPRIQDASYGLCLQERAAAARKARETKPRPLPGEAGR